MGSQFFKLIVALPGIIDFNVPLSAQEHLDLVKRDPFSNNTLLGEHFIVNTENP